MLFRITNEKENMPALNSKKMDKYCGELLTILNDETKALKAFKKCTDIIENSGFDKSEKQNLKLLSKTKVLADYAKR